MTIQELSDKFSKFTGIRKDIGALIEGASTNNEKKKVYDHLMWHLRRGRILERPWDKALFEAIVSALQEKLNIESSVVEEIEEQEIVPYIISGGYNNNITNIDAEGYSASVQFKDHADSYNLRIGASCVGGSNWATPLESGKKHTITITLADDDTSNIDLYIAALESEITDIYSTVTPVAYATINTGSSKVLALEVTNNYGAVYIYTTNNGWNLVKITSVECKIENT